jgi:pimeloyl-ACP methyl ester carboxylesterase
MAAQQAGGYGPRVRGTVLEGAGHIAGWDAPDEFASAVEAFWADGDHR